ncbi:MULTISPECIES: TolC family protein [unclassified Herbaspirillum]|uniref:TolC family protein n=1 Tax=unclassified Herbaspirillum TaxID=2624150 RepID=UPI001E5A7CE0|nr:MULTISPECIES: TolC family protein [unclassified Herbaspirillum]
MKQSKPMKRPKPMAPERHLKLLKELTAVLFSLAIAGSMLPPSTHAAVLDELATPLVDPLLAQPPVLEHGKPLPGDQERLICSADPILMREPLSLADAIDLALCQHPQVQAAWAGIKIQAAQVGEARAAYLPSINAGAGQSQSWTSPAAGEGMRATRNYYAVLTWRLLDSGTRAANQRAADAMLEAAAASHDATLQKAMANVISLYFEAQSGKASEQARAQSETLARLVLATAVKREQRGVGSRPETLQARTFVAKAELESARASGQYQKALVALNLAMGTPVSGDDAQGLTLAPFNDDEPAALGQDLREWLQTARQQHPAILAAQAQLDVSREKVQATRAEGLPTVDLSAGQYINGRPNQSPGARGERDTTVGVSVNIPLFDGFSRTYKVRGAQGQVELRQAELRDVQAQVQGDIASAYVEASAALRNLASSRRLLEAAQSSVDAISRKYDSGIADIVEMLNAQAALSDASQERIRTLSDWRSARLRLLANAGRMSRSVVAADARP